MKQKHWIATLGAALLTFAAAAAPLAAKPEAKPEKPQSGEESAPLVSGLEDLNRLDRNLVALAGKASPATVSLMSIGGHGAGSGVVVSSDGVILTAGHVLAAMSDDIIVLFPDGRRAKAKPLGADFDRDAGMVKIIDPGVYPYVEMADGKPLRINDWCIAMGHPGGFDPLRTPPLRLGRVIHSGDFLITDCAVVGGDSGGPLFDTKGRVVGIHSNIGATLSQNRHVPIAVFRDKWDELLAGKRTGKRFASVPGQTEKKIDPDRPVFGVKLEKETKKGIVIGEVMKNSPAAKAGLKPGDVIFKAAGKKIATFDQLHKAIGNRKPGSKIGLKFRRDGKAKRAKITLVRYGDLAGAKKQPEKKGDDADLDAYLDKMLKNAKNGELRLELTPEQIEKFGGMEHFQKRIKERLASRKPKAPEKDAEKPEKKTEAKPRKSSPSADLGAYLDKMLKNAKAGELRLELTPEQIEKFGGMKHFQEQLQAKLKQLDPELLKKMFGGMFSLEPDDFFLSSLKALEPVTRKCKGSVVSVLADGKPVALGTVVDGHGRVLTKDTETRKGTVTMQVGKEARPATLVRRYPAYDLALFEISPAGLHPVRWLKNGKGAPLGSLLTTPDPDAEPLGIGVLSVKTRPLGEIGFLGIQGAEDEKGVLVDAVIKDSAAAKAGLKKGDVIVSIDGRHVEDGVALAGAIGHRKAGQTVAVGFLRGGKKRTAKAKLMMRPVRSMPERFRKMNRMSGELSEKQSGFPEALQHDIPLEPSQCGGPLVDLKGRCVGINVSRAGRVKTYAIPASQIGKLLARPGKAPAKTAENSAAGKAPAKKVRDISEIRKSIEQIQRSIKEIDQRLEKLEDM
jgi:serine protease Do